jgi:hypothetical protein
LIWARWLTGTVFLVAWTLAVLAAEPHESAESSLDQTSIPVILDSILELESDQDAKGCAT